MRPLDEIFQNTKRGLSDIFGSVSNTVNETMLSENSPRVKTMNFGMKTLDDIFTGAKDYVKNENFFSAFQRDVAPGMNKVMQQYKDTGSFKNALTPEEQRSMVQGGLMSGVVDVSGGVQAVKKAAGLSDDVAEVVGKNVAQPPVGDISTSFEETINPLVDKYGLSKYTQEDYKGFKVSLSQDRTTGYVVKPDGDLVSVFNTGGKGAGAYSVVDGIENGATKLDAYDGKLVEYYKRFGFEEVGRDSWNDIYAPAGWNYIENGRPDIVYMKLNGEKYANFKKTWDANPTKPTGPVFERNFRSIESGAKTTGQTVTQSSPVSNQTGQVKTLPQYTPNTNLPPADQKVEKKYGDFIKRNYDQLKSMYQNRFGKVINTDNAREFSSDYVANRSLKSAAVHEPSSNFTKNIYTDFLTEPPSGRVVFTAGGTGAGKSTAIRGDIQNYLEQLKAEIVYDTNTSSFPSASKKIDQALASGRPVNIQYVLRDPVEAMFNGALPRAERVGRTVPIAEHVKTHVGALETIKEIVKKYGDKVKVTVIDNSFGKNQAREIPTSKINDIVYNKDDIERRILDGLLRLKQQGKINPDIYQGFVGGQ